MHYLDIILTSVFQNKNNVHNRVIFHFIIILFKCCYYCISSIHTSNLLLCVYTSVRGTNDMDVNLNSKWQLSPNFQQANFGIKINANSKDTSITSHPPGYVILVLTLQPLNDYRMGMPNWFIPHNHLTTKVHLFSN